MSRNDCTRKLSTASRAALEERIAILLPPLLTVQRSSWEQGSAAQALLESDEVHALPGALSLLYGLVHDATVRQALDGRFAVVLNGSGTSDPGAVDPACIGESVYYLLRRRQRVPDFLSDEEARRFTGAVEEMLRYLLTDSPRAPISESSAEELLSHRIDTIEIWSDAVYMLPPFLASLIISNRA